jgi:nucleoside-diphosphate kinase
MIQQTLVLVKPDGVARGLIGEVIKRFEQRGLKIIGLKMVQVDPDFSKKHYASHIDKDFYKGLEGYITSGPVAAIAIEGLHAVEIIRKIVGETAPKDAIIGTIRGDFAHVSFEHADKEKKSVMNLIHASGTLEEAKDEIALWFSIDELHSYKRTDDEHVL